MIDLIAIFVWVVCKAQQIVTELFGYFFIILVVLAVCGLGVPESALIWVALLAVALLALNRLLIRWTEMEE